ncbi:MAG: hypothetical protein EPO40_27165 [Myxococcaceae bacterium]|nr:MAG: hypothetical protein EPO40_27165 [Myxococcaceae bacterium]
MTNTPKGAGADVRPQGRNAKAPATGIAKASRGTGTGTHRQSTPAAKNPPPATQPIGREALAFLSAAVARVAAARRDLDGPWLMVAAFLCGADWLRARRRGRGVLRALVLRDVVEARDAWATANVEEKGYLRHALDLTRESMAQGLRLGSRANQRRTRRALRLIGRNHRRRSLPANYDRVSALPGFRAALTTAMASLPVVTPDCWSRATGLAWPRPEGGRRRLSPGQRFAQVADLGATWWQAFEGRPGKRSRAPGSFGNDIIDRALASGIGPTIEDVRTFFRMIVAGGWDGMKGGSL